MDSLSTQKAKPRKMKNVMKKSRAQILLDLFYRVIEITVVVITVAKLCYQLVITFEGSGLAGFLMNRHVAFVLGNAIVIAVVAKCGFFVNQEPDARGNSNDFYDEFVRASSRGERSLQTDVICRGKQSEAESVTKQSSDDKRQSRAKQSMLESRVKQSTEDKREKQKKTEKSAKQSSGDEKEKKDITVKRHRQNIAQNQESSMKSYERSKSENLECSKKSSCEKLKRSETARSADVSDSDDELRYKIESFIARQRRNQKDEEFCII